MSLSLLLSANYLPSVPYFHAVVNNDLPLLIERFEHYPKQTYRSRTRIATANGILELFLPIQHGRKMHVPIKDVKINYDHDWQRLHWMSLQAAYRSSAYFEYYEDDFAAFYEKKVEYLLDYNLSQLEMILKILKIKRSITLTDEYIRKPLDVVDFRDVIHPKKASVYPNPKPYYQIFEDRNGFIPDVSIIDLIFNQGPQSKLYL